MITIEVDERDDTVVVEDTVVELGSEIKTKTQLTKLQEIKTETSQKLN